jgi:7,8-dihydro-6-hydroxymethylpterin-pyrophosphokinase
MVPLAEIAPDWIIPTTGKTVQFHLQDLLRNSKAEELCHTIE